MQGILTPLTDKQETVMRPISLAGIVGIHFHRHTSGHDGFVGDVALQFSKGPLGRMSIRAPVLLTEKRAGKPWSFVPGMNRRSFEGAEDGGNQEKLLFGGLDCEQEVCYDVEKTF